MATFTAENITYSIPGGGELFKDANDVWKTWVFIRSGDKLYSLNFKDLGESLGYKGNEALWQGRQYWEQQTGLKYDTLGSQNMADVYGALKSQSGFQQIPVSDLGQFQEIVKIAPKGGGDISTIAPGVPTFQEQAKALGLDTSKSIAPVVPPQPQTPPTQTTPPTAIGPTTPAGFPIIPGQPTGREILEARRAAPGDVFKDIQKQFEDLSAPLVPLTTTISSKDLVEKPSYQLPDTSALTGEISSIDAYVKSLEALSQKLTTPELIAAEKKQTDLTSELETLLNKLTGKETRLAEEETKLGLTADIKALQELNLQIAQKTAEYMQGEKTIEGQPIPAPLIQGQLGELKRQQAIDIGVLEVRRQALQGNFELSQNLAKRTVELEFAPIERQIEYIKTFLDLNKEVLTKEEKKRTEMINDILDKGKQELEELKKEKYTVFDLMIRYPLAGIQPNDALETATVKARNYEAAQPKPTSKPTESDLQVQEAKNIENRLVASRGTDGFIDPVVYQSERLRARMGPDEFDKRFSYLLSEQERKNLGIEKTEKEAEKTTEIEFNTDFQQGVAAVQSGAIGKKEALKRLVQKYPLKAKSIEEAWDKIF